MARDSGSPGYGEGREALLRAAIRVVADGGLRRLTYRAVAAEAGVTHGLVRHHFGSREALISEALQYSLARSVDVTLASNDPSKLDTFAEGLPELVDDDPDLQAFQYELVLEARRTPELQPFVTTLYDNYRTSTQRELERFGIQDPLLADLVFAALDGLVFQQVSLRGPEHTRAALARLTKILRELRSRASAVAAAAPVSSTETGLVDSPSRS